MYKLLWLATILSFLFSGTALAACKDFDQSCRFRELIASRGLKRPGQWKGKVYSVVFGIRRVDAVEVTITPTSSSTGTWVSSPVNVFSPSDQLLDPDQTFIVDYTKRGTWRGSYFLVADRIMATDIVMPSGSALGYGRSPQVGVDGDELVINETSSLPSAVTVLRRSK